MQFTTLYFAVFFVLTLTGAWLARRWPLARKLVLLAASACFYSAIHWQLTLILLGSAVVFWGCGEGIARTTGAPRKAWLVAGVLANLGLLGLFKYYNFFTGSLDDFAALFGLSAHLPVLELLAPVGMSFYVFQGLSYLFDLARGTGVRANLLDFTLFQLLFPQLLAGPICRPRELLPQITASAPAGVPDLTRAATLILSGLFKKVVLAHFIDQHLVTGVFAAPENYTAPALWAGLLGYTFLIYWDFSGYTDLARGLGLLLGFRLPENFDHPYMATDISDFWRRWHMTLSFWLRDYLFLPLANRWSAGLRRVLSLRYAALLGSQLAVLTTFILCGLWHGAAWTFVLWGAYHGVLLFTHHGLRGIKRKWRGGWAGRVGTFVLVMFGWLLFNSPSLKACELYFTRMFDLSAPGLGFTALALAFIAAGLALQAGGPALRQWYIVTSERLPLPLRPVWWLATGLVILALKPSGIAPYIYFGF
jgi:alginate O-acetyltransferase complex protein AlgI